MLCDLLYNLQATYLLSNFSTTPRFSAYFHLYDKNCDNMSYIYFKLSLKLRVLQVCHVRYVFIIRSLSQHLYAHSLWCTPYELTFIYFSIINKSSLVTCHVFDIFKSMHTHVLHMLYITSQVCKHSLSCHIETV